MYLNGDIVLDRKRREEGDFNCPRWRVIGCKITNKIVEEYYVMSDDTRYDTKKTFVFKPEDLIKL